MQSGWVPSFHLQKIVGLTTSLHGHAPFAAAISTMIERGVISAPGGTSEPYAMQLVEITESIQTNQTSFLGTGPDELYMGLHQNNSVTLRSVFLLGTTGLFALAFAAMLALRFCTAPKICTTKPAENGDFENVVSPDAALQKWKPNLNGAGLTRATLLQVADDSRLLYEALKDAGWCAATCLSSLHRHFASSARPRLTLQALVDKP